MPYSNLLLTSVSQNYSLAFHTFVPKFPYSPSGLLLNQTLNKTEEKMDAVLRIHLLCKWVFCSAVQPQSCSPVTPTSTIPTAEDHQLGLAIQIQSSKITVSCVIDLEFWEPQNLHSLAMKKLKISNVKMPKSQKLQCTICIQQKRIAVWPMLKNNNEVFRRWLKSCSYSTPRWFPEKMFWAVIIVTHSYLYKYKNVYTYICVCACLCISTSTDIHTFTYTSSATPYFTYLVPYSAVNYTPELLSPSDKLCFLPFSALCKRYR